MAQTGGKKGYLMTAAEALASFEPPPPPPKMAELTKAQQAAKEKLENPTVDADGEHIQTVEEARAEAIAMQQAMDAGLAMADARADAPVLAQAPAPEPAEKDDGHEETVEEVKAKMAAAQRAMDAGMDAVNSRAEEQDKASAMMPDMGALTAMHGSLRRMGLSA